MKTKNVFIFFEKNLDKFNNYILKIYNEIVNCIFPPVCGICGKISKNWLCDNCQKRINKLEKSIYICIKNKKFSKFKNYYLTENKYKKNIIFKNKKQNSMNLNYYKENIKNNLYNKKIQLNKIYFDGLIYCFNYKGLLRNLILKYKFNDSAYLYKFFSTIIINKEKYCRILKSYDIIIPVPMYEKKFLERGYNQTELIAKDIALKIGIKLEKELVQKIKNTKIQSSLSKEERKKNIKNAFLVNNKKNIKNKKIIIFDDIYTTGETVNELSRVLKKSGAKEILIFVIAKD